MNIEIALFDASLASTYSINMALHKSQRTKTLNSGLIVGYNIVFLFSFVNNIGANWCLSPNSKFCEFTELSLLKDNILKHKIEIVDGCVKVPEGPGFGVELNEKTFEKYTLPPAARGPHGMGDL